MLQPDKLKKLNENALKMSQAGNSQEDILAMKDAFIKQFGAEKPIEAETPIDEPVKKKEDTTSTSTTESQKLDLAPKNGSLVSPLPKKSEELMQKLTTPEKREEFKKNPNKQKLPENRSFLGEVTAKLATGSSELGVNVAAVPELLYDVFSAPQNAVADMFDIPSLKTDSDKFKEKTGINNSVKEYYQQEVKDLRQKSAEVDKKYQFGVYDSFVKGNYADGFRQLTGSFAESLPATTSIMVGGAFAKTPQLLAASTMMFGAGKNEQLKEDNPDMNANIRVANALATGLAEGAFESLGSGSIGAAAKGLIEREGKEKAFVILKDGLQNFYKEQLKKNPLTASIAGEGIEEWATQVTQNSIDVATGVKPDDYNVFTGGADAFLGGAFGGSVFGAGLKGIDKFVNIQDQKTIKVNNKKIFELQNQLSNPDVSEVAKKEIQKNIDNIVSQNKKLVKEKVDAVDNLDPKIQKKLSDAVSKIDEVKAKVEEIKLDATISDETKQILLDNLKKEFKDANDAKLSIIDGKTSVVDVLPLKEQDKIKRQALKELTAELNPDGSKNITITNNQILERANKLYKTEQENLAKEETLKQEADAKIEVPTTETEIETAVQEQPTVVQETEQEVVGVEKTTIKDAVEKKGVYVLDGEKGEVSVKGNIVVFETKDKIIDLGTTEDVSELSLDEFGIERESEIQIKLNEDNSVEVEGKVYFNKYSNPDSAISKDKDGNYTVSLETENGQKRTFRGARAEQIVYETKLKKFQEDATEQQIDRAIEITDKAIRVEEENRKSSPKRENKSVRKAKRKQLVVDEETQTNTTPTDGNISVGIDQVGNMGVEEKPTAEVSATENLQPANEPSAIEQTESTRKQVRIKATDAKIDDLANALKDLLPKAADTSGLKKQGISQDDLIDFIAKNAKILASGVISIDEAIKKVIDHLNSKGFDVDVNVDDVKEKIQPAQEQKPFERKQGKKSLLGRLIEGGKPKEITEALKELNSNYDVRNQEKADLEAQSFIDNVGVAEALHAAKNNLIANADVRMLVYNEALTRLKNDIDAEIEKNPSERDALIEKFKELSESFDNEARNMGQGLAVLNYIYNKNQTLKYNLSKVIDDYKRNDVNGEIPTEVKAKFEELDKKLKDLEQKIKEAEARAKVAEDELAIKNVQEDIERKKQLANKNKSGLTPREQTRKKELTNKFFGRFNDITSVATMLADPEFREYLGLTFKQVKGDIKNFSNKIINELGKGAEKHLDELFNEAQKAKTKSEQNITIGKDGKIKIPAQIFRDLVEQGHNDIDEIAKIIHESISDEHPDIDVIDVRDTLTGYGKTINKNEDQIAEQINKLKEYGRLLSAYNDVINGKMPLKSGFKREKPEQKARELRREVNRLAKELNIEPVDLEKQWASALVKIKSSLENQIEDLDKQIANGEKRKIERTNTPLDADAIALKELRDAKKKLLDEMVGKPELTAEQKIAKAELFLENSIKKIQEDIDENNIAFKEKPTPVTSAKIEELRAKKKALLEVKKQLRQEAGLIEEQRLKTAKTRVRNQIEDLRTKLENKDFAKKEVKPILADNELNSLRAEKEAIYEEYEKQKYIQELANRTKAQKFTDAALEVMGVQRSIKASLDLGLIGIQLRGFTYAELLRNPIELGRKFLKLFGAIGSQKKTDKAMSLIIGHPLYNLAKKLDIGITHPDLRNEVREEMASGNLLHIVWNAPMTIANILGQNQITEAKKKSLGDTFIDSIKKQFNKISKNRQLEISEKEKISREEQWKNVNPFEAVERGLSTYGNQMRFEEFIRGVERLKVEGKDEINHKEDYEALASYLRTFSGRANPAGFKMNQKALNVFFFSFKNAVSVFQQLNPYYIFYELNKANIKKGVYKPTVAGKMAMATMFKSVSSTAATMLFLMAAYNAFKDDDDDEMTVETDPRSSDFGKLKVGALRYDPWGGYIPLITLYARLGSEKTKKSDGTIEDFGKSHFGIKSRWDATSRFLFNKESPGFQMFHHYMASSMKLNKESGEMERVNDFGQTLSEDQAFSLYPIFLGSVKEAAEKDPDGFRSFLTAYSVLGLGNVQEYTTKETESSGGKRPSRPSGQKPPRRP